MIRQDIENYMIDTLGYERDTIEEYKSKFDDKTLLEIVQQDLDEEPDDFWADGVRRTAVEEIQIVSHLIKK